MKIFLASGSVGRKNLLDEAEIKYEKISHFYDEIVNKEFNSISEYVSFVAKKKLEYLNFNKEEFPEKFIIISADTMCSFEDGEIIGKPKDFNQAKEFFRKMNKDFFYCATGLEIIVCEKNNYSFKILENFSDVSLSKIWTNISEKDANDYIKIKGDLILTYASGLDISGFGAKFIKKIEGSYTGIIGLQMCELKEILEKIKKKYFYIN